MPIEGNRYNEISQEKFKKIPGSPISYWVSENIVRIFSEYPKLGESVKASTGLQTSNSSLFLRRWFEVSSGKINSKWISFAKGGAFRKWYGNNDYVVNWEDNGKEIKIYVSKKYPYLKGNYSLVVKNETFYFQKGLLTSRVTSGSLSFRYSPKDEIFSDATTAIFPNKKILFFLGLLNSKLVFLIEDLNPTLNFQAGDLEKLPIIFPEDSGDFDKLVSIAVKLSKTDWDSYEASSGFTSHPLIR